MVADSHLDPYSPSHSANLRAVFEHIGARPQPPAFVFHVGDVVESGLPPEYEEWDRIAPPALRDSVRAVPGNHEVRWDEWAKELYLAEFGQAPYSFDAAGVHAVALDPTQLLQEPGFFAREQLRWLRRDLRRAGAPAILFLHYPVGADNFYVGNQDALLDAIDGCDVRAIVAGHIHREEVVRQNGATLITLPGVLNVAAYHWARREGDALVFERAQLTGGAWQVTPVAEVPLRDRPPARPLRRVRFDGTEVEVRLDPRARPVSVRARLQPEAMFGGASNAGWVELAAEGGEWRGALDTTALAAGTHRLQVQTRASDGAQWDAVERVRLEAPGGLRATWEADLGASVQAGLAALPGGRVVAATTAGRVVALTAGRKHASQRWRFDARAPVLGTPLADPAGERLFVPSASGRVHALDARDGGSVWAFDAGRPALASPAWTGALDEGAIIAAAGRTLHALDAGSGRARWSADVGALVAGRPAVDEGAVYVGAGDGKAHAFDLRTGERRWSRVIATRESPYRTLIYGPWATSAALLPGGRVLVSNVVAAYALDRVTGAIAWQVAGGFMYNAPLLLDDRMVLADERGNVLAVDPLSGAVLWRVTLPQRVLGGSPVGWGSEVAVAGVNGLVAVLDPATGADRGRLRPGVDYIHGAPAAADQHVLAVAGQDGVVRGVTR